MGTPRAIMSQPYLKRSAKFPPTLEVRLWVFDGMTLELGPEVLLFCRYKSCGKTYTYIYIYTHTEKLSLPSYMVLRAMQNFNRCSHASCELPNEKFPAMPQTVLGLGFWVQVLGYRK